MIFWFSSHQKLVFGAMEMDGNDAHFKIFSSSEWVLVTPGGSQGALRALLISSGRLLE